MAGAVLSTLATVIQMAVVVGATSPDTLRSLAVPLLAGGTAAALFGVVSILRMPSLDHDHEPPGRPFSLRGAVAFAVIVSAVLLLAATLNDLVGSGGALLSAGIGGFADAHAGAVSITSLAKRGTVDVDTATAGVLIALTTNTVTKVVVAAVFGGSRFAAGVSAGLVTVLAVTWAAAMLSLLA
jgi:uncharacterized membrane protein (DUF4010 family)